jgi:hypothetical protein
LERARNAKHEGVIVVVAFSLRYPHFAIRQTKMARSYSLFFLTLSARAQRSAAQPRDLQVVRIAKGARD